MWIPACLCMCIHGYVYNLAAYDCYIYTYILKRIVSACFSRYCTFQLVSSTKPQRVPAPPPKILKMPKSNQEKIDRKAERKERRRRKRQEVRSVYLDREMMEIKDDGSALFEKQEIRSKIEWHMFLLNNDTDVCIAFSHCIVDSAHFTNIFWIQI